jgi:hypothetical protein
MSAHLVETSEEDSFLAVARYIGDLLNEGQVSRRHHHCATLCSDATCICNKPHHMYIKYITQHFKLVTVRALSATVGCIPIGAGDLPCYGRLHVDIRPYLQERTALADTPGSTFTRKCEALLVEGSFGELLSEFAAQVDLLLRKVTDKGVFV